MKEIVVEAEAKRETDHLTCYHCGQGCEETVWHDDKVFCCYGCKTVFEILSENNLCEYYSLDEHAGVNQNARLKEDYRYLDTHAVRKSVLQFESGLYSSAEFRVPAIHCVSCIWLLENLQKINNGILNAEVNFPRKTVAVNFDPQKIKLSEVAALLDSIGYRPEITETNSTKTTFGKELVLKLAIAGFCFGNIMLFSFPEYLGLNTDDKVLMRLFSWLNVALAVPVFVYSASSYFTSTWNSLQRREINIDVPIALGLVALFLRSLYDIITATGPGYLDSFAGLVFFLLIGRWFQSKTYESLAFDRDFKSYFPLSINRWIAGEWQPSYVYDLRVDDLMRIRNMEIIPADSILDSEKAYIDYSFVTGESRPVKVVKGDFVYAGGRIIGAPVILKIQKEVSQSHLTSLWNHSAFKKVHHSKYQKIIDRAARKFTWIVLAIAFVTAVYWQITAPSDMWLVLTSVLMVACPCALALAAPFTYGSMLRVFGNRELYLKNADVIERLAHIDAVVFDKTGTVTTGQDPKVAIVGKFSDEELAGIKTLTLASVHPLSMLISKAIHHRAGKEILDFIEINGKGISGIIDQKRYKIGSASFIGNQNNDPVNTSKVFVSIDDEFRGCFSISISVRSGLKSMLNHLGSKCVGLLSGDNDSDKARMSQLFPRNAQLLFGQDPHDKLEFIKSLQRENKRVLMIGDGLNDAGALKQADVGIAVTDDTGLFSPASDGILAGSKVARLDQILKFAKSSNTILQAGFGISFFYNAIALGFAVTGNLTPLIAAIIMPISSITVVSFSSLAVRFASLRHKF